MRRRIIEEELGKLKQEKVSLMMQRLSISVVDGVIAKLELIESVEKLIDDYYKTALEGFPYNALKKICDIPMEKVRRTFNDYLGLDRLSSWCHYWASLHVVRTMYQDLARRIPTVDAHLYKSGQYLG